MSDKSLVRGLYYFDVAAALVFSIIVTGRLAIRDSAASPALIRDVAGLWVPLLAIVLLIGFRRWAYTRTPWVAVTFAALAFVALGAIYWRWNVLAFMVAMLSGAILLLAGLVLRTKRLSERLGRTDRFALIAMVGSVVLTVALAEAALRLGYGFFNEETQQLLRGADPSNFGVAHPYVGHLHTPNNTFVLSGRDFRAVHHVDGLGFRNEWPWPEQADIVTVGDSVTFGQCVEDEEAWPAVIRRSMSPGRLINLGLIGAGPQQYLRVFETFGVKLRPKLLLVGVFARNDFWDAGVFDRWLRSGAGGNYMVWRDFNRARPPSLSLRHPRESLEGLLRFRVLPAFRRSYLFVLLRGLRGGLEGEALAPPRTFRFANGRTLELHAEDFLSKMAAAAPDRGVFRLLVDSLQQLHSVASRQGTHVLMVLLPGKEEVYLPLLGVATPDPTGPLRSALDNAAIEYLDLAPGFRTRAAAGEQLFFEVDGHPNPAGQALIAQLVREHIRENAERYGLIE